MQKTSVVILASGAGTRLGNITHSIPKPLLSFGDKPYLQYMIDWLLRNNLHDIVVTAYTHADQIESFVKSRHEYTHKVSVVREQALINTVTSAAAGLERVEHDTCFILTADNLWDVDLAAIHMAHTTRGAQAMVMLTDRPDVPHKGQVLVRADDAVMQMWPMPGRKLDDDPSLRPASTMGVYLVNARALLAAIRPEDTSIEREPMDRLIPHVTAYWNEGFFFDYGTPENYRWLQKNPAVIHTYLK